MKTLEAINDQLKQPLDVTRVKKRQGGGGSSLSYIETHDVISTLNRVFGFDGWEFQLLHFEQFQTPKGLVFRQTARLIVKFDGRPFLREDVGIGIASNANADQLEKGMKESASDALKRCARTLGEQFGNSLYQKDAPEHQGEQRAALPTEAQYQAYCLIHAKAVEVGVRLKTGDAPPLLPSNTNAATIADRADKLTAQIERKCA